jgi:hypothetical protein
VACPRAARCHLLLAAQATEESPWRCPITPRRPSPLLPFLSPWPLFSPSPSFSLSLHHVKLTVTGARRLAPLSRASPSPADVLRRSPTSSSTSPFKELTRGASNRRHRRGYLAGNRAPPPPNSPPLAHLWPIRHHRRVPGEISFLLDPSPFLFPRRSARHGQPLPASGSRSGWAICPSRPWPANVASGPSGQWLWVILTPGVKS